ncbi:MAG TPA: TetR/AcrR family transcriptional regulator [Thermomicrobiales bacterium]|nr:TetR/AcrR family transcriptional regulator [Thermomicrobiales bacterium]
MSGSNDAAIIASPLERRRRNRQEMTDAILTAARAVMREEGVAALNLQKVARRVGVRAPSLYEYFPSKAALYDALFALGVRLHLERVEHLLDGPVLDWEGLRAAIEGYMGFAHEYPELWKLVYERPVPGFVPSEESMAASRQFLERSVEAMRPAIEKGTFAPGVSPEQATDLFIAVLHGLTAAHMANQPDLPAGEGRFGSLIPAAVDLFRIAWDPERASERSSPDVSRGPPGATQR